MIKNLELNKYYSLGFQTIYKLRGGNDSVHGNDYPTDVMYRIPNGTRWVAHNLSAQRFCKWYGDELKELTEEEAFSILL